MFRRRLSSGSSSVGEPTGLSAYQPLLYPSHILLTYNASAYHLEVVTQ